MNKSHSGSWELSLRGASSKKEKKNRNGGVKGLHNIQFEWKNAQIQLDGRSCGEGGGQHCAKNVMPSLLDFN